MSNYIHIPSEIIINILTRLPVLSLLRFTPACKLWYSIITNPKFITTHLNLSREISIAQLLFNPFVNVGEKTCLLINEDYKTLLELAFPSGLRNLSKDIYVIGTCNGLICLSDGYGECAKHVIIWNPTIRKSVTLTLPEKQHQKQYTLLMMGFGFVLGKNNYKFVRILYGPCFNWAEVYEQGGEWRVTECAPPPSCQDMNLEPAVFVLGALHWLTYDKTVMTYCSIIVFDMRDEVFREIRLPPPNLVQHPSHINLSITTFDSSLALIYHDDFIIGNVELWVMRDYGVLGYWTKMYDIVLPSCWHVPLSFRKSGEILFLMTYGSGKVELYDSETKSYSCIGFQNDLLDLEVDYFIESLVLLEGEKAVTDRFAHLL